MTVTSKTTRQRETNPRNLRKGGAEAGVMSGSASGEGSASLVEIAVWNHFGTERTTKDDEKKQHIPPRPFLTQTAESKRSDWESIIARVNKLVLEGKIDANTASEILGQKMQADIQQTIIDYTTPKNADSTIAQKGKDDPLVDNGALKDSIKYQVIS